MEVAERMADGLASVEEISDGHRTASFARDMATGPDPSIPAHYKDRTTWLISLSVYGLVLPIDNKWISDYFSYLHDQLNDLHDQVKEALEGLSEIGLQTSSRQHQATLLRDLVGNPYRPVAFCQKWRTPTATALAQRMYESRDFGAMPILADALEEAGCDSEDVLSHCRGLGPHVRGCWVVDAVLVKE